jgi:histidyl-tRNA synthetase
LELNSLGQPDDARRTARLIAYWEQHADCWTKKRSGACTATRCACSTPKTRPCRRLVNAAPKLIDYLGEASLAHFNARARHSGRQRRALPTQPPPGARNGLLQPHGVRICHRPAGCPRHICGGGRYDYLIEQIGGKPAPAVGWALGVERVLEHAGAQQGRASPPDAYAVVPDVAMRCPRCCTYAGRLRDQGVQCKCTPGTGEGMGSMKSQFKKADASGRCFALIFGADELARAVSPSSPCATGRARKPPSRWPMSRPGPALYNHNLNFGSAWQHMAGNHLKTLEEQEQLDQLKHLRARRGGRTMKNCPEHLPTCKSRMPNPLTRSKRA